MASISAKIDCFRNVSAANLHFASSLFNTWKRRISRAVSADDCLNFVKVGLARCVMGVFFRALGMRCDQVKKKGGRPFLKFVKVGQALS